MNLMTRATPIVLSLAPQARARIAGLVVALACVLLFPAYAGAQVVVTDPISHINQIQHQITNAQNQVNTYQLLANDIQRVGRDLSNFQRYGGTGAWGSIISDMGSLNNDAANADPKAVPATLRASLNSQLGSVSSMLSVLQARADGAGGVNQALQVQTEYLNQVASGITRAMQYQVLKEQAIDSQTRSVFAPPSQIR